MLEKSIKTTLILLLLFCVQCSQNTDEIELEDTNPTSIDGTGVFEFTKYEPLAHKPVNVYYHIPSNFIQTSKIVMVFHGMGRNAFDYRSALIDLSEKHGFALVVPKFSGEFFPSGDAYNLGNVFVDGDNPSESTLNPEQEWTFSLVEPIFEYFKELTSNVTENYDVIGHSAGAQFAHRFVMFKPDAKVNKMVISAPGWYTLPDSQVDFPYGFEKSPLTHLDMGDLLSKTILIQVGEIDNNSNATGLRRNQIVDRQGTNRYDRAHYFYSYSQNIANTNNLVFSWQLRVNEGLGHNFEPALRWAVNFLID